MYWVEQMAWQQISLLDPEFDEWEYGQEVEQRYRSRLGTYGTSYLLGQGKVQEDYRKKVKEHQ